MATCAARPGSANGRRSTSCWEPDGRQRYFVVGESAALPLVGGTFLLGAVSLAGAGLLGGGALNLTALVGAVLFGVSGEPNMPPSGLQPNDVAISAPPSSR